MAGAKLAIFLASGTGLGSPSPVRKFGQDLPATLSRPDA